MTENNELEQLQPEGIVVDVGNETLTITPIRVKELAAFTKAVAPMLQTIQEADPDHLMTILLMNHTEAIIRAVAIGIRRDMDLVNNLDIDDLVKLGNAVLEVNIDFFIQKVLPALQQGRAHLMDMLAKAQDGQKSTLPSGAAASEAYWA